MSIVKIWTKPLNPTIHSKKLRKNIMAGAYVSFEGWVRQWNKGKKVKELHYEAYTPMAIKEIKKIMDKAKKEFSVLDIHVHHRTGTLQLGEIAVWMGVTGEHRKECFKACEYVIAELKKQAPIWKEERITL